MFCTFMRKNDVQVPKTFLQRSPFVVLCCHLVDTLRYRHHSARAVRREHDGSIYHVYFVTLSKAVRLYIDGGDSSTA